MMRILVQVLAFSVLTGCTMVCPPPITYSKAERETKEYKDKCLAPPSDGGQAGVAAGAPFLIF